MKVTQVDFGKRIIVTNPTEFQLIKLALPLLKENYDLQGLLELTLDPMMDEMERHSRNGVIEISNSQEEGSAPRV